MLRMMVFYDSDGNVVGTLDHLVQYDDDLREAIGLVDFEAFEAAGGRMREIKEVSGAVGSATWPEWIGAKAHDFQVELDPDPGNARARIKALVHKKSGHRRERHEIEAAISERINEKKADARKQGEELRRDLRRQKVSAEMVAEVTDPDPEPADIRDIVGGPGKPLLLDEDGRTRERVKVARPDLPVVKRGT
jgi:hypothetical protein